MLDTQDKKLIAETLPPPLREHTEEYRATVIEDYSEFLMQKGNLFYPWTREHFEEALASSPEGARLVAYAMVTTAIEDMKCDNDFANMAALSAIEKQVVEYWKARAVEYATERADFNP